MVDVAVFSGDGTAGDDAADVPGQEGALLGGAGQAVDAAERQDAAVPVQQHGPESRGAGQQCQGARVHRPAVLGAGESLGRLQILGAITVPVRCGRVGWSGSGHSPGGLPSCGPPLPPACRVRARAAASWSRVAVRMISADG